MTKRISTKTVKFHSREDVIKLLEQMKNSQYFDFIHLLYGTGLRISEACALTADCWNPVKCELHIKHGLNAYSPASGEPEIEDAFYLDSTKGNDDRILHPSKRLSEMLTRRCTGLGPKDLIFTADKGKERNLIIKRGPKPEVVKVKLIHPQYFSKSVYMVFQQRAGITNILSVHATRHTYAAHFVMNGGTIYELSKKLGHKSSRTTEIYAHLSGEYQRKTSELVDFSTRLSDHVLDTFLIDEKKNHE